MQEEVLRPAIRVVLALGAIVVLGLAIACGGGDDGNGSGNGNGNGNGNQTGSPSPGPTSGVLTPGATIDGQPTIPGGEPPTLEPTVPLGFGTNETVSPADASAVASAVGDVVDALDAGDRVALRALAGPRLAANMDEDPADLDQLLACWPEATFADERLGDVDVNSNTARVRVNFSILRGTEPVVVDRIWEFEWNGSRWLLRRLPPCPPS